LKGRTKWKILMMKKQIEWKTLGGKKQSKKKQETKNLNQRQNENERKSHNWKCQYMDYFILKLIKASSEWGKKWNPHKWKLEN
jgi:hypothetical protein